MSPRSADVAVIGLGAMGSMAAWQLAARGASVVGIDRFTPGHDRGSSHGGSRIFREILFEGVEYVPVARAALALWRQLEHESGDELLTQTGGLVIGPGDGPLVADARASAEAGGVEHELLDADEVGARFPQHALVEGDVAVYEPGAGVLRPEAAIRAAVRVAEREGAQIQAGCTATGLSLDDDRVEITTDVETLVARRAIVATGAWLADLLGELDLPVRIQRSCLAWFHGSPRSYFGPDRFPTFVRESPGLDGWGIPDIDGRGVKVGAGPGPHKPYLKRPEDNWREPDKTDLGAIEAFCRGAFPGLAPKAAHAAACMNSKTPDEDFIVGIPATAPSLVLLGGFSGHGFKHAPGIGRIAAELALDGATEIPIDRFSPDRFGKVATGSRG